MVSLHWGDFPQAPGIPSLISSYRTNVGISLMAGHLFPLDYNVLQAVFTILWTRPPGWHPDTFLYDRNYAHEASVNAAKTPGSVGPEFCDSHSFQWAWLRQGFCYHQTWVTKKSQDRTLEWCWSQLPHLSPTNCDFLKKPLPINRCRSVLQAISCTVRCTASNPAHSESLLPSEAHSEWIGIAAVFLCCLMLTCHADLL